MRETSLNRYVARPGYISRVSYDGVDANIPRVVTIGKHAVHK